MEVTQKVSQAKSCKQTHTLTHTYTVEQQITSTAAAINGHVTHTRADAITVAHNSNAN